MVTTQKYREYNKYVILPVILILVIVLSNIIPVYADINKNTKDVRNKGKDDYINPDLCFYVDEVVTEGDAPILPDNVNSPYNRETRSTNSIKFYWEFGSLASASHEYSFATTITAHNGESSAYVGVGKIKIIDRYLVCPPPLPFLPPTKYYIGRFAEIEQRYPGEYLITYEHSGDMVDNTVLKVYLSGSNNYFKVSAIYKTRDDYISLSPGTGSTGKTIYMSQALKSSIDISISIYGVGINGVFKASYGERATREVNYIFHQHPLCAIVHNIDYLGSYDISQDKYPMHLAFSTSIDCPLNNIESNYVKTHLNIVEKTYVIDQNHNKGYLIDTKVVGSTIVQDPFSPRNIRQSNGIWLHGPSYLFDNTLLKGKRVSTIRWIINGTYVVNSPYLKLRSVGSTDKVYEVVLEITLDDGRVIKKHGELVGWEILDITGKQ